MAITVGINGYGRIGRTFHRALLARGQGSGVRLGVINDPQGDNETHAYLLQHDSVGRTLPNRIEPSDRGIIVDGDEISRYSLMKPSDIPWEAHGVDVVIDATGIFANREAAAQHLTREGVRRVIISAPADDADLTICMGINHRSYDPSKHVVVSNASCTTNCLAPMAMVLHNAFGIRRGYMNTIHAYTGDQALHDVAKSTRSGKPDLRRMRAAGVSVLPSSTGAAKAIGLVIPELLGKIDGRSMRVPVPDGSYTDFTAVLEKEATVDQVNDAFRKAACDRSMRGVLAVTDKPWVSADVVGNPASCVFSSLDTMVLGDNLVNVGGWYDNEGGYSNRLIDLCLFMAERGL